MVNFAPITTKFGTVVYWVAQRSHNKLGCGWDYNVDGVVILMHPLWINGIFLDFKLSYLRN